MLDTSNLSNGRSKRKSSGYFHKTCFYHRQGTSAPVIYSFCHFANWRVEEIKYGCQRDSIYAHRVFAQTAWEHLAELSFGK